MDKDRELGLENDRQLFIQTIRDEIEKFDEEHPFSVGEYFGNFEQKFPGGNQRNHPAATSEHLKFLQEVDTALQKTEADPQNFIRQNPGEQAQNRTLLEQLGDLRQQFREKRDKEKQLTDENVMEKVSREMADIRGKVNELLIHPYIELRLRNYDHFKITE